MGVTVSVSEAVLLPVLGSMVVAGTLMVAALTTLPPVAVTVAVTVKVRVPPDGMLGSASPLSRLDTPGDAGQVAPPVAAAQLTPVLVRPAATGSVRVAAVEFGPALLTVRV